MRVQRVKRRDDVIWDLVDGTMTLYQLTFGELFELSGTGGFVWDLCAGQTTDTIISSLLEVYPDQPMGKLSADVLAYLRTLEAAGLIEMTSTSE
jgi:hypothetical protein